MSDGKYPECEKLAAVVDKSNDIGEFIDWLGSQGISLAVKAQGNLGEEGYLRQRQGSNEQLLADYFKIDLRIVEQERRTLLASLGNGR